MTWESVLDLTPLRLKCVVREIRAKRAQDTAAMFDAVAAVHGDEKALNRLKSELRVFEEE